MKIGILTFQGADNFGSVLQSMGLRKAIIEESQLDEEEVYIIDYIIPGNGYEPLFMSRAEFHRVTREKGKKEAWKRWRKSVASFLKRRKRLIRFRKFREETMNLSRSVETKEDFAGLDYDICVTGSDQVWNPYLTWERSDFFFLKVADDKTKKISYAASTGSNNFKKEHEKWFIDGLSQMNAISIREKSVGNYLAKFTNKRIFVCLDPTMLHTKEEWEKYERKPKGIGNKPYILMYGFGYPWVKDIEATARAFAREVAEHEGLQVLHYYYGDYRKSFRVTDADFCYQGPREFLWLVHHAERVINVSYHGTVFSVLFERPFYTFSKDSNSVRMADLVQTLGIEDRLLTDKIDMNKCQWNIDWNSVREKLVEQRKLSRRYLHECLTNEIELE